MSGQIAALRERDNLKEPDHVNFALVGAMWRDGERAVLESSARARGPM
jgi:hypothetical protein